MWLVEPHSDKKWFRLVFEGAKSLQGYGSYGPVLEFHVRSIVNSSTIITRVVIWCEVERPREGAVVVLRVPWVINFSHSCS